MKNSPIFIVGCPRSGTTLLRNLLRSHPNLSFPSESHFIPKLYKLYGHPKSNKEAKRIAAAILKIQWVREWNVALKASSFSHFRTYSEIISKIYETYAAKENKPRWGDKTPQYLLDISILVELYPKCKILNIYRDGRDVALSWKKVNFGPRNTFMAALTWKKYNETGFQKGRTLPKENYLEVRHESLLNDPEKIMKEICDFIEEPFFAGILKPTIKKTNLRNPIIGSFKQGHSQKKIIVKDNVYKWKTEMKLKDRILFESVAVNCLARLDYEIEGNLRNINYFEKGFWITHHFLRWLIDRLNVRNKKQWIITDIYLRWIEIRCSFKEKLGVAVFKKSTKNKRHIQ